MYFVPEKTKSTVLFLLEHFRPLTNPFTAIQLKQENLAGKLQPPCPCIKDLQGD
jgi:hypothetical protein